MTARNAFPAAMYIYGKPAGSNSQKLSADILFQCIIIFTLPLFT